VAPKSLAIVSGCSLVLMATRLSLNAVSRLSGSANMRFTSIEAHVIRESFPCYLVVCLQDVVKCCCIYSALLLLTVAFLITSNSTTKVELKGWTDQKKIMTNTIFKNRINNFDKQGYAKTDMDEASIQMSQLYECGGIERTILVDKIMCRIEIVDEMKLDCYLIDSSYNLSSAEYIL
jgi:hypothetical protein